MLRCSDPCVEVVAALIKAQGDMGPATKGATNPHFKSSYADLGDVVTALRGPLGAHGLGWVHAPCLDVETGVVSVETRIFHSSGQWISCAPSAVSRDLGPQPVGSLITYLKRYGLQALTGLPSEDDDGNTAQKAKAAEQPRSAQPKPPKKDAAAYANEDDKTVILDHANARVRELAAMGLKTTTAEVLAGCLKPGASLDMIPRVHVTNFLVKIEEWKPKTPPVPPEPDLSKELGAPLPNTINYETGEVHE